MENTIDREFYSNIYGYVAGKDDIGTKVSLMYAMGCDYVYADRYNHDMAYKLMHDVHNHQGNLMVIIESLQDSLIPSFLIEHLFKQQQSKIDCLNTNCELMYGVEFETENLELQGTLEIVALDERPDCFTVVGV